MMLVTSMFGAHTDIVLVCSVSGLAKVLCVPVGI